MAKAKISNRIRRLRFDHDEMTQQELATCVGCSRQTVILLEHGRYVPSLALAFRVAGTFGLTVDEVFKYEEEDQDNRSDKREIGPNE
jgi:putative transcriptional regulator